MNKKQMLKDAFKSPECEHHLINVIAEDEKCPVEDLTVEMIIHEVKFVLSKYTGGIGYEQEEEFLGEHGIEAQKEAKMNVKHLKNFLKKYS